MRVCDHVMPLSLRLRLPMEPTKMLAVPAKRQTVPMLVLLARFHEECGEMA